MQMPGVISRLALMAVLALPAAGNTAQVVETDLQRRTMDLAAELRCAVCQNQSVAESQSDLAKNMRQVIEERLLRGESDDAIKEYFVARYGNYVLMRPPRAGTGLAVWLGPPMLLLLGVAIATAYLRRRRGRDTSPLPELSPDQRVRVDALRGRKAGRP